MLSKLESRVNTAGEEMVRKTQRPIADAIKEQEGAKEKDKIAKQEEAAKLREEMEKRKQRRLDEQMKQEEV